jgi:hypothetical protein
MFLSLVHESGLRAEVLRCQLSPHEYSEGAKVGLSVGERVGSVGTYEMNVNCKLKCCNTVFAIQIITYWIHWLQSLSQARNKSDKSKQYYNIPHEQDLTGLSVGFKVGLKVGYPSAFHPSAFQTGDLVGSAEMGSRSVGLTVGLHVGARV